MVVHVVLSGGVCGGVLVALRVLVQLLCLFMTVEVVSDVVERSAKVLTLSVFVALTINVPAVSFSDHDINPESFSNRHVAELRVS